MKREIQAGKADYSALVFIPDPASTDGSGKTGLVAANLTVSGTRMETDNDATVNDYTSSLNDLAALTTAHTDWGLKEISSSLAPGLYRLDIADALFASGAWTAVVYVMITTSAAAASPMEFVIVTHDPDDRGTPQTGDNFPRLGAPAGASVSADVAAVKAVLPAALVAGRMDSSVGAMAANVLTATAINADAITAAKIADGAIDAATFAAGAINAAAIGADAITDAKVAADVTIASVTGAVGSVTGAVGSVTGNVGGNVTGSVGSVAAGGIVAASFGAGAIDAAAIATDALGALELAAGAASEIASAVRTELTTELGRIDAAVSTRATQTSVDTIDDFVDTEVAAILAAVDTEVGAIKTKTDQLTFSTANRVDSQVFGMEASTVTAAAIATDAIDADALKADAVTEIQSGLATTAALATVAGYVDTEVAAIKAVTDKLDDTLEDDGGTYRFTTNALEQAPSGGGSAPTVVEIADEVQTRTIAAVTTVNGLAANTVNASALAADAVAEIQSGLATAASVAAVQADTDDIQTRLPGALVGGRMDSSVGAVATGAITAGAIAADAIGASELAADAVTEIAAGVRTNLTTELGRIDVAISTRLATAGYTAPDNTSIAAILVDTAEIGAAGAGLTALASAANLATLAGYVDTEVAAIKAKTDNLPADPADASDIAAATNALGAALVVIDGNVDAILDDTGSAGVVVADKTGYRLSSAGVDDILRTVLTEGYAAQGAAFTLEQALYMLWSLMAERGIVGTTLTAGKLDHSSAMTFTLDDATTPTAQERAT